MQIAFQKAMDRFVTNCIFNKLLAPSSYAITHRIPATLINCFWMVRNFLYTFMGGNE